MQYCLTCVNSRSKVTVANICGDGSASMRGSFAKAELKRIHDASRDSMCQARGD
jgi:hypothetical protein